MSQHPPPDPRDVVIVTTAAQLTSLIDEVVGRAVRQAVAALPVRAEGRPWLPARGAASAYGRTRGTLYRWRREGRIESKVIAGSVYFRPPGWEETARR